MNSMDKGDFLSNMQTYVANIAISGSTLRNQGAQGVVAAARKFLGDLALRELVCTEPPQYACLLTKWTTEMRSRLPVNARHWGTARKAINVFMVQTFLNKYLCREFELHRFGDVLETPLDSKAASELRKKVPEPNLPNWNSIKALTEEDSTLYQQAATTLAQRWHIPRACLDTVLWRAG